MTPDTQSTGTPPTDPTCPDADQIVALCEALDPADPWAALHHLVSCDDCRELVASVSALRAPISREMAAMDTDALADRVVERWLAESAAAPPRPSAAAQGRRSWGFAVADAVVAAMAGASAALLLASGGSGPGPGLTGVLTAAALCAVVPLAQDLRASRRGRQPAGG